MTDTGFKVLVELTPEKPMTPMFQNVVTMADLQLRIMRLETMLLSIDHTLAAIQPLIPGLSVTRDEIARIMDQSERKN